MASNKDFTKEDVERAVAEALKVKGSTGISEEALKSILTSVIPATMMAMEQAKAQTSNDFSLKALRSKQALEEVCHVCRQAVGNGRGRGCGGPWRRNKDGSFVIEKDANGADKRIEDIGQFHVQMVVFPNDPIAVRQWDGVKINGAYYNSQGANHKIWVPKVNDIAGQILKFEEDQRIQQIGRKFERQSGSLGKNGSQVSSPTFT